MNRALLPAALVCAGVACFAAAAAAQGFNGIGGSRGNRGGQTETGERPARPPPLERLAPKIDPRQRLDPGALFCPSEADLQQHQAAIAARLNGEEAPEPAGCRPIRTMTPVTVLDRHGPARTQVRLPGQPGPVGWTDAVVRDQ